MVIQQNKTWNQFKAFVQTTNATISMIENTTDYYELCAKYDYVVYLCTLDKSNIEEKTDFEANYLSNCNQPIKREVVTQLEKDDKTLRTVWAIAQTNLLGIARVAIKVPNPGRYIAYGDAEFEQREFGDIVTKLEVSDLDRLIAWQIALSINPLAIVPVPDSVVQSNGYPLYPVLGFYDERALDISASNNSGAVGGGMAMTFNYGNTEAQTVGGYGYLPGGMYFVLEAKKATPALGKKFQVSIDWAEPNS